jgi:hypothetical protein
MEKAQKKSMKMMISSIYPNLQTSKMPRLKVDGATLAIFRKFISKRLKLLLLQILPRYPPHPFDRTSLPLSH